MILWTLPLRIYMRDCLIFLKGIFTAFCLKGHALQLRWPIARYAYSPTLQGAAGYFKTLMPRALEHDLNFCTLGFNDDENFQGPSKFVRLTLQ
jgi:hypothetical protein